ncbi:hypothetical protein L1987_23042 [Smallanthus sonchifolius]|uniref:Uncharacterized protein n=1 Tax=Smallanthus sonchifolius TaxID=185202 RepID=A0ACB9IHF8_9ASTR|nr:hypothetical protein L1987_23042 [Smallanthus sonchifolius]
MLPWAESKYQVTSFIYATAHVNSVLPLLDPGMTHEGSEFDSNWMGYIAVSSDDYNADTDTDTPQVMGGWLTIYNTSDPNSEFIPSSARTQLSERMKDLLGKYKHENVSITCTGHSLGACLAVLSAFDIARNVVTPDINVSAFVFASPQVGNQSFKAKMEELPNLKVLRVKNDPDIVPFWPSKILKWVSENIWSSVPSDLLGYVDVGVELLIDTKKSPYLKNEELYGMLHPMVFHNLQGMLHTLSGWNGKDGDFDWGLMKRSLGWVNMSTDLLRKEFKVPVNWWAEKNRGMVLNEYGDWVLSPLDRRDHDLPVGILVRVHSHEDNIWVQTET